MRLNRAQKVLMSKFFADIAKGIVIGLSVKQLLEGKYSYSKLIGLIFGLLLAIIFLYISLKYIKKEKK